jgi:hypothetical protein
MKQAHFRYIFLILFSITTQIARTQQDVLQKIISISNTEGSIASFLNHISKSGDCFFSYNETVFDKNTFVQIKPGKFRIDSALRMILPDTSIYFKSIKKHIILFKNPEQHFAKKLTQSTDLQGRIVDKETSQPLSYTSVGIRGTNTGTVSNEAGVFHLKVPEFLLDSVLYINTLGYEIVQIPIRSFINTAQQIFLNRTYISLMEIIVRSNNPNTIVESALNKRKFNCFDKNALLTSFYREGCTREGKQISCSEAVIKVFKTSYLSTFQTQQIRVEKARKLINSHSGDSIFVKLKAGPSAIFDLDFVGKGIDFFDEQCFDKYDYKLSDIVTFQNTSAYVIEFQKKNSFAGMAFKGRLFIETNSLALVSAEFETDFVNSDDKPDFIVKKKNNTKTDVVSVKYRVDYKKTGTRRQLDHVRGDINLKVKKKKSLFAKDYKLYFEFTNFETDTINVTRFNRDETLRANTIFIDENENYDTDFWGDFNFVSPDEVPTEIMDRFQKK